MTPFIIPTGYCTFVHGIIIPDCVRLSSSYQIIKNKKIKKCLENTL